MPCRGPYTDAELRQQLVEERDLATRVACELSQLITPAQYLKLSDEATDWIAEHEIVDMRNQIEDISEEIHNLRRKQDDIAKMLGSHCPKTLADELNAWANTIAEQIKEKAQAIESLQIQLDMREG